MPKISDILAQIAGEPRPPVPKSNPALKRKADVDLQPPRGKSLKIDHSVLSLPNNSNHIKQHPKKLATAILSKRGLGNLSHSQTKAYLSPDKTGLVTPPPTEPSKPPKKGSYAEILARGKAAQAVLGKVGKIQHKPVEKTLSKRERQELKEQESSLRRGSKKKSANRTGNSIRDVQNESRGMRRKVLGKGSTLPEKKVKKAQLATTGYAGTARPNPAAASRKISLASTANDTHRHGLPISSNRFASLSEAEEEDDDDDDDEEDEDEEDEEAYGSDMSSDMEAAVFEVDEEEERASRIARKEDEAAAREEARLKREKDEKRRRLVTMNRNRR